MKRLISIFITSCFLFSFVFSQSLHAFIDAQVENTNNNQFFNSSLIPTSYGKIVEEHVANTDRVIINIQDLHCHPQTQKNISNIIELLDKKYGISNIYLEGAYGQVNTAWIKNLSKDKQIKLINKMIDLGLLTGAEYYSIKANKSKIIKGLENKKPYLENLNTLSYLLNNQEQINLILQAINDSTYNLKQKYYSKELLKLEKLSQKHISNKISSKKYYDFLIQQAEKFNINLQRFPNVSIYIKLLDFNSKLKTKEINNQLMKFLFDLKEKLPYSTYKALLDNTNSFSQIDVLYEYLVQLEPKYNLQIEKNYPQLYKYFNLTLLNKRLNPILLVKEEALLTKTVSEKYATNKAQKEVIFLTYFYKYLKDYLNTKITADDYQYYKRNINTYKLLWNDYVDNKLLEVLNDYIKEADKFYKVNLDRNNYFANNIFGGIEGRKNRRLEPTTNNNIAMKNVKTLDVVITGGFHSQTVNNILKDKNVSYIVITPTVTGNIDFANNVYQSLIKEQSNIANQKLAVEPFSLLPQKEKIKIITFRFGKNIALEMFGQYIYPKQNELENISELAKKLDETILEIQINKFLNSDDTKPALEILESVLSEKLDPQIIEYIDFEALRAAFNKVDYIDDVKSIVEKAKKLHKHFSMLQSTSTKKILDYIGKIIYKDNVIKAKLFKYSTVGLVLTSLFELPIFFSPNFVSKYHKNNNIIMHIAHGTILAISFAVGVAVTINPISNWLVVPAILATSAVLHFIYDFVVIKLSRTELLLQSNIGEQENEHLFLTQKELERIEFSLSAKQVDQSLISEFISFIKDVDFGNLLTSYGNTPVFRYDKMVFLKSRFISVFENSDTSLLSILIKLVLHNEEITSDESMLVFTAKNNNQLNIFARLAAYIDWKKLCNEERSIDSRLTDKTFLRSLMHIYESHSIGFNAAQSQRKTFYDDTEFSQDFAVSYNDLKEIPTVIANPDLVIFMKGVDYSNNITFGYVKKINNTIYYCLLNSLGNIVSFYKLSTSFYLKDGYINVYNILLNFSGDIYINENSKNVNIYNSEYINSFSDTSNLNNLIQQELSVRSVFFNNNKFAIKNNIVYAYGDYRNLNPLLRFNEFTQKFETLNTNAEMLYDIDDGQIIRIKNKYFYCYQKGIYEIQEYTGLLKTTSDFYFIFLDNLYSISSTDEHFVRIQKDNTFKLEMKAIKKLMARSSNSNTELSEDRVDTTEINEFNAIYPKLQQYLLGKKDISETTINEFIQEQEKNANEILELIALGETPQEQLCLELQFAIFGEDRYSLFQSDIDGIVSKIDFNLNYKKEQWLALILQTLISKYGNDPDFDLESINLLGFYNYEIFTINDFIKNHIPVYDIDEQNIRQAVLDTTKYDFFGFLNLTDETKLKKIIERHFGNKHECISYFDLNSIIAIILEDFLEKDSLNSSLYTPHICYKNGQCYIITDVQHFIKFYKITAEQKIKTLIENKNITLEQSVLAQLYYGILGNNEFNRQKSKILNAIYTVLDDNLSINENIVNVLKYLIDNGLNPETQIFLSSFYKSTTILNFIKNYDSEYFLEQKRQDNSVRTEERIELELTYILGEELYNKYLNEILKNISFRIKNSKYQDYFVAYILDLLVKNNGIKDITADTHIYLPSMYDNIQTVGEFIRTTYQQKKEKDYQRQKREKEENLKKANEMSAKQIKENMEEILKARERKVYGSYNKTRIKDELYNRIRVELSYGILSKDIFNQNRDLIKQIVNEISYYSMDNEIYFNFILSTILVKLINNPNIKEISYDSHILIPELYSNKTTIKEFIEHSIQNINDNKDTFISEFRKGSNLSITEQITFEMYFVLGNKVYFEIEEKINNAINNITSYYFVEDDNYDINLLVALTLKQLLKENIINEEMLIKDDNDNIIVKNFIEKYATIQQRLSLSLNATKHIRAAILNIEDIVSRNQKEKNARNFKQLGAAYNNNFLDVFSSVLLLDIVFPYNPGAHDNVLEELKITNRDIVEHIDNLKDFIKQKLYTYLTEVLQLKNSKQISNKSNEVLVDFIENFVINKGYISLDNCIEQLNSYNVFGEGQKEKMLKLVYPSTTTESFDTLIDRAFITPTELILLRSFSGIDLNLYRKLFNLPNVTETDLLEAKIFAFLKTYFIPTVIYDFKEEIMQIIKKEVKKYDVKNITDTEINELTNTIIGQLINDGFIYGELLNDSFDKNLYSIIKKQDDYITDNDIYLLLDITANKNIGIFNRLYAYLRLSSLSNTGHIDVSKFESRNIDDLFPEFQFYDIGNSVAELIERGFINIKRTILSNDIYKFNALMYIIFNNFYVMKLFANTINLSKLNLLFYLTIVDRQNTEFFNEYFTFEQAQNIALSLNLNFTDYIFLFLTNIHYKNKSDVNLDNLTNAIFETVKENPILSNLDLWKNILSKYIKLTYDKKVSYKKYPNAIELFNAASKDILKFDLKESTNIKDKINGIDKSDTITVIKKVKALFGKKGGEKIGELYGQSVRIKFDNRTKTLYFLLSYKDNRITQSDLWDLFYKNIANGRIVDIFKEHSTSTLQIGTVDSSNTTTDLQVDTLDISTMLAAS